MSDYRSPILIEQSDKDSIFVAGTVTDPLIKDFMSLKGSDPGLRGVSLYDFATSYSETKRQQGGCNGPDVIESVNGVRFQKRTPPKVLTTLPFIPPDPAEERGA